MKFKQICLATLATISLFACSSSEVVNEEKTSDLEPTESFSLGSATINITSNMTYEEGDSGNDSLHIAYIYYSEEKPDEPLNYCFVLSHTDAIDYRELDISESEAKDLYIDALPQVTDWIYQGTEWESVETKNIEMNGYPAYYFKCIHNTGAYFEGYSILTDKYDNLILENIHGANTEDYQDKFDWIVSHVSGKKFVMGNKTTSSNSTASTTNGKEKVTCSNCNGTGQVKYYYGEASWQYNYGTCTTCEGKGYVMIQTSGSSNNGKNVVCPSCGRYVTELISRKDKSGVTRKWCKDCWKDYDDIMG